ncbi:hypothetical protein WR25_08257 [Diploscapter pachys]|uniref:Inositol polyphosphate-related phosphatase domain-containing protein n=1 Tax=Diploscapter pachys TaxID=2018661 RepID=A0A2A2LHH5_9BILA|nr:hypothetical protein WR25_08257 [Diploscapter pachys]
MTFYSTPASKAIYVPGRDPSVDEVMRSWQHRYCTFEDTSICISTFNVNGRSPPAILKGWFSDSKRADFYAVGLQEMDLSVGTYIIDNTKKMEDWIECIRASLPGGSNQYHIITSMRLVGIFVVLFKQNKCKVRVTDVSTNYVATGISVLVNKLGNKGATAISARFDDTLVCFVNSHFAAGNNELERRNQDFRDVSQLSFLPGRLNIYDHDVIFWFGDLNYRLNWERIACSGEDIRIMASSSNYRSLLKNDQLKEQIKIGAVFVGFHEKEIFDFRPTYKYDVGTDVWDSSEKGRVPAWTDRILWWKSGQEMVVEQKSLQSINNISISDHKPVVGEFRIVLKCVDQKKANSLYEEAIREADRRANELLPQIQLSQMEVEFGHVLLLEPKTIIITIKNTGKSQAWFRFKNQPSVVNPSGAICAPWLTVSPSHYLIPIQQSTQISLTVFIDETIAASLDQSKPVLQDILVLSLDNGRDHFIPVSAKFFRNRTEAGLDSPLVNQTNDVNLIDFAKFLIYTSSKSKVETSIFIALVIVTMPRYCDIETELGYYAHSVAM